MSQVFIDPQQYPDVRCVCRGDSNSVYSQKSSKLLRCFSDVHQKELHPNKIWMFCLLLLFTCFLRSLALSRLKRASFRFCFFLQACKRSLQAFNSWQFISLMCKVKNHIRISSEETWQESKYVFTESLSVIGEENLLENVSDLCIHQNSNCHLNFSTLKQRANFSTSLVVVTLQNGFPPKKDQSKI